MSCSLYCSDYWFGVAASATALGYFLIFFPVAIAKRRKNSESHESCRFGLLIYSIGSLLLTLLLLVLINAYSPFELKTGVLITLYCFTFPVVCGFVELYKSSRKLKLGVDLILAAGYLAGLDAVLNKLLEGSTPGLLNVDLLDWSGRTDGNVAALIVGASLLSGILLIIFSLKKRR